MLTCNIATKTGYSIGSYVQHLVSNYFIGSFLAARNVTLQTKHGSECNAGIISFYFWSPDMSQHSASPHDVSVLQPEAMPIVHILHSVPCYIHRKQNSLILTKDLKKPYADISTEYFSRHKGKSKGSAKNIYLLPSVHTSEASFSYSTIVLVHTRANCCGDLPARLQAVTVLMLIGSGIRQLPFVSVDVCLPLFPSIPIIQSWSMVSCK